MRDRHCQRTDAIGRKARAALCRRAPPDRLRQLDTSWKAAPSSRPIVTISAVQKKPAVEAMTKISSGNSLPLAPTVFPGCGNVSAIMLVPTKTNDSAANAMPPLGLMRLPSRCSRLSHRTRLTPG